MGRFALIVVFWMKTDFCCQLVFSFQHWKPWGGGMVVHFEGFPNSSILLDFVWFRPCWLCLPEMRMGKRSTRCIICVSTKDAVTQMARSLQEEKTTSSQGPMPLRQLLGQVAAVEAKPPSGQKALWAARLPVWKAKFIQSAFIGNFKEQDEGHAQEVAAVCRDSLPWWNHKGKEKTTEAKPQLVPARGAN